MVAVWLMAVLSGRTLEERAQRLFLTKGKKLEDLDPAFFTKSKPGKTAGKTRYKLSFLFLH